MMPTCKTCNLPYQAGRAERHRTTYSHRAALGAGAERPARASARRDTSRIPAVSSGENFGQRMARRRAEKKAAAGG